MDITVTTNNRIGSDHRLLMITNSFGNMLAPAFSRAFQVVTHINANQLQAHEKRNFYATIADMMKPTHILFVYQETAAVYKFDDVAKNIP
jgi:hypothetical protein